MKKKYFNYFAILALFSFAIAPLSALATTTPIVLATSTATTTINTTLTRDPGGTGGAGNPVVKAQWEMDNTLGTDQKYLGTDAATTTAGAQFMPSGAYQVGKTITVCSVVTDPNGVDNINNVYADVFYPTDISTGPNHEPSRLGCGQQMPEFTLNVLSKSDGIELFCNKIRNNNNSLPTYNSPYDYNEICAQDGELQKETANVYCGNITLSYEDPDGAYRTQILAQDKGGLDGTSSNTFTYLPLTAFQTDFTSISYPDVLLNTSKIISGNLTFAAGDGKATVRNIGNTRLSMSVRQTDMGLSTTNGQWNVQYGGRVGSNAAFVNYYPEVTQVLAQSLNLSETNEMDFSVKITKFPVNATSTYLGTMLLTAQPAAHITTCPNPQI